ncbi:MAG TPA: vanadium-dependent haloperoxidase, partial [Pyrinomonadaceae bacterium]
KVFALVMLFGLTAALAIVWDVAHAHNMRTTSMKNPKLAIHPSSTATTTSDAVVLEWNQIAVATIGAQPPFPSARFMATVQLAVFEAVNSITGKYEPYLGTIIAPQGASAEAAAVAAAHGVLKAFFPAQGATLDQQRSDSLATIPDGQAKTDGIAVGEAAAAAMIANRTNDGSAPPQFHTPPNSDPYERQTTAGCPPGGGIFKHWPNVKPFGVESSSQFRADPPPKLTSGTYARDYNEVLALGEINSTLRPQDRADIALLYAAQPPHYGWNSVLRQIASTRQDDITTTARIAAVMNMSLSDAFITMFESKYFYRTWRPVTAIPRGAEDGNAHTAPSSFTPFILTPCFPGYPSGHGSGTGAALEVVERAYGRFNSVTMSHPGAPGIVIQYNDLRDIIDDVSDARVFGGIHFRSDQDAGERLGREVGRYINHNRLRPLHDED